MELIKSTREIQVIYLHCTGTMPGVPISRKRLFNFFTDPAPYGRGDEGYTDIGYHYVINPSGNWYHGRPVNRIGGHVKGDNRHSIGVSMVGNWDLVPNPERCDPQLLKTGEILARLCHMYGIKPLSYGLLLHREAKLHRGKPNPRKSCPGVHIKGPQMRRYVKWHYDKLKAAGEFDG